MAGDFNELLRDGGDEPRPPQEPRPTRQPPPAAPTRRRSRPFTLAILGAATLCTCCCCAIPAPDDDSDDGGGSDFAPGTEIAEGNAGGDGSGAAPRTPTTSPDGRPTSGGGGHAQGGYHRSYIPFWMPLFFGRSAFGGGGGGVRPGMGGAPNAPGVSRGGFGGAGRGAGGGAGA